MNPNSANRESDPTVHRVMELTERKGYSLQEWMWALNLAAGNDSTHLKVTAKILAALSTVKN